MELRAGYFRVLNTPSAGKRGLDFFVYGTGNVSFSTDHNPDSFHFIQSQYQVGASGGAALSLTVLPVGRNYVAVDAFRFTLGVGVNPFYTFGEGFSSHGGVEPEAFFDLGVLTLAGINVFYSGANGGFLGNPRVGIGMHVTLPLFFLEN
jgi:hypothetical protein